VGAENEYPVYPRHHRFWQACGSGHLPDRGRRSDTPDQLPEDLAEGSYTGVLYLANFFGAILAAIGIYRGRSWGWALGALVSVGAFVGYVISRTVGLPGLPVEEEWLEPLGLLSLLVEALFVGLYLTVFVRPTGDAGVHGKARRS